jgi:hypothetical protein
LYTQHTHDRKAETPPPSKKELRVISAVKAGPVLSSSDAPGRKRGRPKKDEGYDGDDDGECPKPKKKKAKTTKKKKKKTKEAGVMIL